MWTSAYALVQRRALHAASAIAGSAVLCYCVSARSTSSLPAQSPSATALSPRLPFFAVCNKPTQEPTRSAQMRAPGVSTVEGMRRTCDWSLSARHCSTSEVDMHVCSRGLTHCGPACIKDPKKTLGISPPIGLPGPRCAARWLGPTNVYIIAP